MGRLVLLSGRWSGRWNGRTGVGNGVGGRMSKREVVKEKYVVEG